MKKFLLILFIIAIAVTITACSAKSYDSSGSVKPAAEDASVEDSDQQTPSTIPAGQLTAAAWSDHDNYESFLKQCADQEQDSGIYGKIANNSVWQMPWNTMHTVTVVDEEEKPIAGAKVEICLDDKVLYTAISDAFGKASLFFEQKENSQYVLKVTSGDNRIEIDWEEDTEKIVVDTYSAKQNVIEIMFVIDTTGSMHDELSYIQAELADVIDRVKTDTDAYIRIALLFYRDTGDEYITRYFEFTDDINTVQANLSAQDANGGGDYPEAVHTALDEAVNKQWSSGNVTKLLFHILDAPPHKEMQIADVYRKALYRASEKGIKIIPLAASGADLETQFLLRMEALLTGGIFTFLTDDSGIGYDHLEPAIDGQYTVEFLNSLLIRLIKEYHTGQKIDPIDWRQEMLTDYNQ